MQRWLTLLLGVFAVGLAVVIAYRSTNDHSLGTSDKSGETRDAQPPAVDASDGGTSGETGSADPFASLPTSPAGPDPRNVETGPGSHLPDGRSAPPLPDGAPRQVRIGVVIVAYAGAQGMPPGMRSKREALEIATKLAVDARNDFHSAVVRGDNGSADDVGHIPRGVLELGTEYVIFTMPVRTVSELLETPRGYWIVKRLD
jgi:hypothetical protein